MRDQTNGKSGAIKLDLDDLDDVVGGVASTPQQQKNQDMQALEAAVMAQVDNSQALKSAASGQSGASAATAIDDLVNASVKSKTFAGTTEAQAKQVAYAAAFTEIARDFGENQAGAKGAQMVADLLKTRSADIVAGAAHMDAAGLQDLRAQVIDMAEHKIDGAMALAEKLVAANKMPISSIAEMASHGVDGAMQSLCGMAKNSSTSGALAEVVTLAKAGQSDAMSGLQFLAVNAAPGALDQVKAMAKEGTPGIPDVMLTLAKSNIVTVQSIYDLAVDKKPGMMRVVAALAEEGNASATTLCGSLVRNGVAGAVDNAMALARMGVNVGIEGLVRDSFMTLDHVKTLLSDAAPGVMDILSSMTAASAAGAKDLLLAQAKAGASGAIDAVESLVTRNLVTMAELKTLAQNGAPGSVAALGDLLQKGNATAGTTLKDLCTASVAGAAEQIGIAFAKGNATMGPILKDLAIAGSLGAVDEVKALAQSGFAGSLDIVKALVTGSKMTVADVGELATGSGSKLMLTALADLATQTKPVDGALAKIKVLAAAGADGAIVAVERLVTGGKLTIADVATMATSGTPGMATALYDLAVAGNATALTQIKTFAKSGAIDTGDVLEALVKRGSLTADNLKSFATDSTATDAGKAILVASLGDLAANTATSAAALTALSALATSNVAGALDQIENLAKTGNAGALSTLATLAVNNVGDAKDTILAFAKANVPGIGASIETLLSKGKITVAAIGDLRTAGATAMGDVLARLVNGLVTGATAANVTDAVTQIKKLSADHVSGMEGAIGAMISKGKITLADVSTLAKSGSTGMAAALAEYTVKTTDRLSAVIITPGTAIDIARKLVASTASEAGSCAAILAKANLLKLADLPTLMASNKAGLMQALGDLTNANIAGAGTMLVNAVKADTAGAKEAFLSAASSPQGLAAISDLVSTGKISLNDIGQKIDNGAASLLPALGKLVGSNIPGALDMLVDKVKVGGPAMVAKLEQIVTSGGVACTSTAVPNTMLMRSILTAEPVGNPIPMSVLAQLAGEGVPGIMPMLQKLAVALDTKGAATSQLDVMLNVTEGKQFRGSFVNVAVDAITQAGLNGSTEAVAIMQALIDQKRASPTQMYTLSAAGVPGALELVTKAAMGGDAGALAELKHEALRQTPGIGPVIEDMVIKGKMTAADVASMITKGGPDMVGVLTDLASQNANGAMDQIKILAKQSVPGVADAIEALAKSGAMKVSEVAALAASGTPGIAGVLGDLAAAGTPGALNQIITLANNGNRLMISELGDLVKQKVQGALEALSELATEDRSGTAIAQIKKLARDGIAGVDDVVRTLVTGGGMTVGDLGALAAAGAPGTMSLLGSLATGGSASALEQVKYMATNDAPGAAAVVQSLVTSNKLTPSDVVDLYKAGAAGMAGVLGNLAAAGSADALTEFKALAPKGGPDVVPALEKLLTSDILSPADVVAMAAAGVPAALDSLGNLAAKGNDEALTALKAELEGKSAAAVAALDHQLENNARFAFTLMADEIKADRITISHVTDMAENGSSSALALVADLVKGSVTGAAAALDGLLASDVPGAPVVTAMLVMAGSITMDHLTELANGSSPRGAVMALGELARVPAHSEAAVSTLKSMVMTGGGDEPDAQLTLSNLASLKISWAETAHKEISDIVEANKTLVMGEVKSYLADNDNGSDITKENVQSVVNKILATIEGLNSGLTSDTLAKSMIAAALYQGASGLQEVQEALAGAYGGELLVGTLAVADKLTTVEGVNKLATSVSRDILVAAGLDGAPILADIMGQYMTNGYAMLSMTGPGGHVMNGITAGASILSDPTSLSAWTDAYAGVAVSVMLDATPIGAPLAAAQLAAALVQCEAVSSACSAMFGDTNNKAIQATAKAVQGYAGMLSEVGGELGSDALQRQFHASKQAAHDLNNMGSRMIRGDVVGMATAAREMINNQVDSLNTFAQESGAKIIDAAQKQKESMKMAQMAVVDAQIEMLSQLGISCGITNALAGLSVEYMTGMYVSQMDAAIMGAEYGMAVSDMFAKLAKYDVEGAAEAMVGLVQMGVAGAAEQLKQSAEKMENVRLAAESAAADLKSAVIESGAVDAAEGLLNLAAANVPGAIVGVTAVKASVAIQEAQVKVVMQNWKHASEGVSSAAEALARLAAFDIEGAAIALSNVVNAGVGMITDTAQVAIDTLKDLGLMGYGAARQLINNLADIGVTAAEGIKDFFEDYFDPTNW
ncbi:hypothetical protein [Magnetospirillum moscoviense]|uniref:Uncharacterized protein n=1 Tax=Magnetospirillum moscoviense TaxID=1437059 RepID=A0A178ME96_9PROT|nr:hypothetical protein [Magnetospirillum moscoviense]OAN47141.1 hypothetical protein A6A05_15855 [Magnetospirillum moscoviense]